MMNGIRSNGSKYNDINHNDDDDEKEIDSSSSNNIEMIATTTTIKNYRADETIIESVSFEDEIDASNEGQQQQQQQQRWKSSSIIIRILCWISIGCILQYGWISNDGADIVDVIQEFFIMNIDDDNLEERNEGEGKIQIQDLTSSSSSSSSSSAAIVNKTQQQFRYNSPVKFIFVVGLEGTGHHLVQKLVEKGPMNHRVNSLKLQKQRGWLHQNLWGGMGIGLWAARCNKQLLSTEDYATKVQQKLESIKNILNKDFEKHVIYFVNTLDPFEHFGMVSYPNFETSYCRYLNYPNLDVWYDVCNKAQVDCEHIYIYRDPIQLLHSTTSKRHFNPNLLEAIDQYYTMYGIVGSQLIQWMNHTVGCYGFYENTTKSWYEGLRILLGYKNTTSKQRKQYKSMIQSTYHYEPANQSFIIPSQYDMYMKSLYTIHNEVTRICQNSLQ